MLVGVLKFFSMFVAFLYYVGLGYRSERVFLSFIIRRSDLRDFQKLKSLEALSQWLSFPIKINTSLWQYGWNQIENVSGNEEANDQGNLPFPPRNCSNARSSRVEGKTFWNDECGESGSIRGNLPQKLVICSCCRKRNDQCNAGDALDIVPSKEHNGITQKSEFLKSEQVERYCALCTQESIVANVLIRRDIFGQVSEIIAAIFAKRIIISSVLNCNLIWIVDFVMCQRRDTLN